MLQGCVAGTHPLVCADIFSLVRHGICAKFVPATCRTEFNLLNFMGPFGGSTKLTPHPLVGMAQW